MLEKKLNYFVEDICKHNNFTEDKTNEIQYVMKVLMYEAIKFMIIIALFSTFGYFKEILLIVFTMSLVKPFTGGYHETSQKRCFIATVILSCFIIAISKNSELNYISAILISVVNIFSVYHQAPIINNYMPITKLSLIKKNKIISLVNYIILTIISIFIIEYRLYSNIILFTLTINVCLMFNLEKYK
ncbi:accessory gene regulator B family protein [Paraclostridium dentum]|uniref:accessory gene regulator B family protein n=1 Tax=Paraclostridium dentum TaxID=2662455 RepID=UPI003F40F65B